MNRARHALAGTNWGWIAALALWGAALAGCSLAASDQVSFVGPTIEGVRQFTLSDTSGEQHETLLTSISGLGGTLVWSPDGARAIVRGQDRELYIADIRKGELGACISCGVEDAIGGIAYSPDGHHIAFGADDGLYLVESDGSNRTQLAAVPNAGWVTWSPDGETLVFEGGVNPWDLYRVDADGTNLIQLTGSLPDEQAVYFKPQFSPSGDLIAVHQLRDGLHLMLMSPTGTGLRKLVDWEIEVEIFDPALAPPPVWSPDGQRIAFVSSGVQGRLDVYLVNADGSGQVNLTNHPANDTQPAWSPDGDWIAFVSNRDGNDEIYLMNAAGQELRNISKNAVLDECCPEWRP